MDAPIEYRETDAEQVGPHGVVTEVSFLGPRGSAGGRTSEGIMGWRYLQTGHSLAGRPSCSGDGRCQTGGSRTGYTGGTPKPTLGRQLTKGKADRTAVWKPSGAL